MVDSTNKKIVPKNKTARAGKIIGKIILGFLLFFFIIILLIRSHWGQNFIVDKTVSYISKKTQTKIALEKLFITFSGNIQLDGLYLEDTKGDTLVYSKSLEANVPLWSIIRGQGIGVDALNWNGLRANIIRKDSIQGYNFQFLIDAFATESTQTTPTDSKAVPLNIVIGNLNFKNFDIVFDDAVIGIDSRFKIGNLQTSLRKTDLEQMVFEVSELEMADSNIKFIQKPIAEKPTTETALLPVLALENIKLNKVYIDFQSEINRIAATLDIRDFYTNMPNINLVTNTFEVDECLLKNSSIVLNTKSNNTIQKTENITPTFEWPALNISINTIDFQNNNFSYFVDNQKAKSNSFNPNAMVWSDLNLKVKNISLKDKEAKMRIENAMVKEVSGLDLNTFSLSLNATDNALKITDLKTELNNNELEGRLVFNYPTLSALIEAPEKSKLDLDFPIIKADLKTIFLLQPELKKNPYLDTLSTKILTGNIKANGYLSNISIPNIKMNWGKSTQMVLSGTIKNATDPDNIQFNIPKFYAKTKRFDIAKFANEKDLGIQLPDNIELSGDVKGNPSDIYTKAFLETSQGLAKINGHFKQNTIIEFETDVSVENFQLDELLKNEQLGALNLTLKANGKGKDINNLNANMEANIASFKYNNYDIKDLKLLGDIKDGKGTLASKYKDENLNMNLEAQVVLDSIAPEAQVMVNLKGANLQALGIMQREVKTGMKIYADFKGTSSSYDVTAHMDEGVVVYDNKSYLLGDINAMAHVRKDTTSVSLNNKLLDIVLQSNVEPQKFSVALQRHITSYFYRDQDIADTISKPVNLKLRGHINQAPILNDVFLVNVKDLDTISLAIDFNEKARKLNANITAPHINYSGLEMDSLVFSMDTDVDKFIFDLGFNNIKAGPLNIPKTTILGNQSNNELALNFSAIDDNAQLMYVDLRITGDRDELKLHVAPEKLMLNNHAWSISENNGIIFTENKLAFNDFKISKNGQSIEITDKLNTVSKDHVAINYNNFKISEVLNYLNPEANLATGTLNGNFILEEPFRETGILANLTLNMLNVMDVDLGTLKMDAKSLGGNSYDFDAKMNGGEIDLNLQGDYLASTAGANLDLNLDINKFNMNALSGFFEDKITETSGSFSGNFKVNGTTEDPKYEGLLNFNNANFKLAMFNAAFSLKKETLKINNEGLTMTDFTVRDENQNTFTLSGKVGTESFINPTFDLQAKATNFQFLNATKEDNDFLYGKASFDADAKITGDLQIPKIKMNLSVGSSTNVTYVMPSATVNIEDRDGVVLFVNRENPDAILTKTEEKSVTIKGFDIKARLKVNKEAAVTIVIDKETGDNFKVSGSGDLDFKMKPNGNMTLAGVYEVKDGHYEMNLYNLVNRKFDIASGSRVTWAGNPFDAKMDIRAIYKVETSASSLMAPVFSGGDVSSKGKFRQVLPFFVYLNIDGQLMAPKIAFNLDMPEEEQGAIGGQIYGRVQQLNQQDDELNRQVFSLLVLNRFYPDSGSDGSSGGVASVARDNLNDAVSDQLNTFSDKLLGKTGFELDFGLDSYTDYQGNSPQERTQLDVAAQKKLFNDRLIVRVGSEVDIQGSNTTGEPTPLIGNVSLEYLLSENGRYRLKGFRRNEFENVIDGQTIVSGIAVIFTQEFNKFKELWEALLTSKTIKEEAQEAENEAALKKQKKKQEATNESIEEKKN